MSDTKTPVGHDALATILSTVGSKLADGRYDDALNWAGQAVHATSTSDDVAVRATVISAVTSVIVHAAVTTRKAAMTGAGLFGRLSSNIQVIKRGAELLAEMARGRDSGLGLANALIVDGFATQLASAIAPHSTSVYHLTTDKDFDEFLTTLDALLTQCGRLTTEPVADPTTSAQRCELARTAVSNARHGLSALFPQKLSDWGKALVLLKHARKLVEQSHATSLSLFDAATEQLTARDYKKSNTALQTLEAALK